MIDEVALQQKYYAETAQLYEAAHAADEEHEVALRFMLGFLDHDIHTVLDIGSGTGRVLQFLKERRPDIRAIGIEPSASLRAVGRARGLTDDELIDGDAQKLSYADNSFDLVCEFAALHHIQQPSLAVSEMLRVARSAIFISDSNNFGQGGLISRTIKQMANAAGLWPAVNFIKTRGKGYSLTEGDGLSYSYSIYNDWGLIRKQCSKIHVLNTTGSGINPYRTAPHVALMAFKTAEHVK